MTTLERNDLVPWQATRFPRLPRGIDTDDLESAGNEALIHAATTWDPDGGAPWRTWARAAVRNAMRNVVRNARSRKHVALEIESEDGTLMPRPDPRADDPSDHAAARELVRRPREHVGLAGAPDPSAVTAKAHALREAMFEAISETDVVAVVKAVAEKAKGGDLRAARLLMDLIAPARTGTTVVKQQAIIVHRDDF